MLTDTPENSIRLGIAGLGTVGRLHAGHIIEGRVPRCRWTAVSDPAPPDGDLPPGVRHFTDNSAMLRSGEIDAVLVAAPHTLHAPIGIEALGLGLHVLMEKPLAVHKADCLRLIAAHTDPSLVFAGMFNQRTDPAFRTVRDMVAGGELGTLRRIQWAITTWYRSDAYYASSPWRATWPGEGGGVLVNQMIHVLDLYQWMYGMPISIRGFCHFGRYHDIEVEDDVTAYFEHEDGLHAALTTSTGEAPGLNRLEVHGERGRLTLSGGTLEFVRNAEPMSAFAARTPTFYEMPPAEVVPVTVEGEAGHHAEVLRNFCDAILNGTPLIAPAAEGVRAVELANAIQYASALDRTVRLPLDGGAYGAWLNEKIANARPPRTVGRSTPPDVNPGRGMRM